MKRIFFELSILAIAFLMVACGDQATTNKPANAATNANSATATVNTAAIEADIKKLVTEYAASTAKNDTAALEKTTTDNFMFVSNDGTVQTRAERIASMKSGDTKYESLTYDDLNVRVNAEGNGAVVIGKATVKMTNNGKPLDATVRVTQVWSKTKDGWKMASLQATNITAKADDKKSDEKKADEVKSEDKPASPANK
jgi:ketosteroid isomerase-like protein